MEDRMHAVGSIVQVNVVEIVGALSGLPCDKTQSNADRFAGKFIT